ncbi:carbohydrate-binding protein [Flavicella marina]|uniref:carbohydrate-binding protein n=1 Tax=Flavicella marina TaxID=1475951 RepID=UPI00126508E1|nr:carbohydrate-binding protein [Flavicella marina]
MNFFKSTPLFFTLFLAFFLNAQTVTIDYSKQRFLNETSELDRTKYFTIHDNSSDSDIAQFYADYNAYPGRGFWGPYSYSNSKGGSPGNYLADKAGGTEVRAVSRFISTEHPGSVFIDGLNAEAAGDWAVEYWKDYVNDAGRPEFFEPMNEPFVHASDYYSGGWNNNEESRIKLQMAQVYNQIGAKIHAAPELENMKVVGYSSAWPSLEINDFGHWNDNMKMFMDTAGDNMDGFSTHLYDGVNVTGQNNLRSGSNSEAILDMIEAYSYIKWGVIKDHAITEYGGIASGYPDTYSDITSAQTVRSYNNILFNLLEREDNMSITIPFATGKALWHLTEANNYQPYGAVLLRPENLGEPTPTGWVYTSKIHFYELWKEFKGKRVFVNSDNPDIQAQAFVEGNKLYVALNNLDDNSQTVNLSLVDGLTGFQDVRVKSIKIYDNANPVFSNNLLETAPSSVTLISEETVTLEYTFSSSIVFDTSVIRKKYYASSYLQPISQNNPISFEFNNVDVSTGSASLRMSIGRKHNVSKVPEVKVNGTAVIVPTNWKGYDQANRDDFFGTIEIPVDMNLLTTNNTVTIKFSDTGGHVASAILSVEKEGAAPSNQSAYPDSVPHVITTRIECEDFDSGDTGFAFYDTTVSNINGQYRPTSEVDIQTCNEGGYNISYVENLEWLEYSVNVETAGLYSFDLRYAAESATGGVTLYADSVDKTGVIALPPTGGWQVYQTVTKEVSLDAGSQIIRLYVNNGGVNLNWFEFTSEAPLSVEKVNENDIIVYPNPFEKRLNVSVPDSNISNIELLDVIGNVILRKNSNGESKVLIDHERLENLTNGIYFIKLNGESGSYVKKVVKI